ncbi:MAG: recombinase family protein, partial [Oscillospiraceae bacterium]|nr:recombinase family protein [Oscillospiraceae bacterium]
GYARVSTENQLENYSIEEQTDRLKAYCAAKGWSLRKLYVDGGYSGGNTNRPALQQMLAAVRQGGVDAVVVYKLDRLSRSQKDTLTLIEDELLAHGADFVSINENFDTSTPFGRAMIGILSVFAQLEKDQITERFTMGRIGRSKAGYYHGGSHPPTGYDYKDGLLVVNEYEALQIQEIFSRFLAGKSVNSISRYLSAHYTTKWSAGKVLSVLRNTVYIGKVHFRRVDYDGIHPPLVSEETFQAAARLLGASSPREAQKTTLQKTPFRAGYLLSGLVYCARCGARYSANHGYYKCYSRAKSSPQFVRDPNCKNDNWAIEKLDALVQREIKGMISQPDLMETVLHAAADRHEVKVNRPALQKRIAEIDGQIGKLIDLYQVGSIPMETITQRINTISEERAQLQEQLDMPDLIPSVERFLAAIEDYKAGFDTGDTDNRRMFTSSLVERIMIDGQSVNICWRL